MVLLKYLGNFWRILEMPLINCVMNLVLTWSKKCVIASNSAANQETTFVIANAKLYVPVVTLSTQDNPKLLQKLKPGFRRMINWSKYQSKVSIQAPNPYLDYLIDPSFQGLNRLFVLSFKNTAHRTTHSKYYLATVEIKD